MSSSDRALLYAGVAVVGVVVARSLWDRFSEPRVLDGGTASGGIPGAVSDAVGGGSFSDVRPGTPYANPIGPPAGASRPVDFIVGRFLSPQSGGSVNRALFSSTVRVRVEVTNTSSSDWRGPLTLEAFEDYLISDARGYAGETVLVPARSSRPVDIDYRLSANYVLREPKLYLNLWAGQRFLASADAVEVV